MLLDRSLSVRSLRLWLYLIAGLGVFGAAGMLVWAFRPIGDHDGTDLPLPRPRVHPARLAAVPAPDDFRQVLSRRLRRPLVDPPPPPPPKPSAPKKRSPLAGLFARRPPRLDWRLVGTVTEAGRSVAVLIDRKGAVRVVAEGEALPAPRNAVLRQVASDRVVVTVGGRQVTLELPEPTEGLR